ncbi:MAG: hypothetical protein JEY91_16960 [Spirochaetaceae bacterium]|nr:hypothetical protein [Spirochaetaceae bacterium]
MEKTLAILVTILFISISADAATNCHMAKQLNNCSQMLHIVPLSNHDSHSCCSISSENFEKDISFSKQNSFNPFITTKSLIYKDTTQCHSFISMPYRLSFAYPPPLKTIKLLC